MADKTDFTPELTLTPNLDAAAAAEAPQAPEAPALTLDPTGAVDAAAAQKAKDEQAIQLDESKLTEAERKMVDDFAKQIDLTDSNVVLQYGAAAQKNIAGFSESTLNSVRTKDLGEIGQALSSLVVELKGFGDGEEKKGLMGLFKKAGNRLESMKAQYGKVEANVDKIAQSLEQHQITLLKDVAMFDQMYELNLKYYKELTMYILAGKKKLEDMRAGELPALKAKAEQSGAQEDAQAYNDMVQMCERFEKKLHDLELTRMISVQMGPQTRLLQNNDTLMVEKIQSSLVNTIPLWKSQMVLALGLEHGRQATAAQSAVTEMTNELLKKNADLLKMGTIETAKEAERSVVDIETLQHTNQQLIESLDEVARIGKTPDGRHPPLIDLLEEPEIRLLERVVQGPTGKLARFFNAANPNPADVRGLLATTRHWYAFFSLWTAYLERQGWNQSVDLCAWHTALEMGKSVIGMESLEEQVASLESVPLGRVTAFFRGCRSWKGYARRNIHSYLDGDLEGMLGTSTEFPSRTEQIIDGRNQRFRERMRPFLEEGRAAVFVGSAHMLQLRDMLAEDGFTVRQAYPTWRHRLRAAIRGRNGG